MYDVFSWGSGCKATSNRTDAIYLARPLKAYAHLFDSDFSYPLCMRTPQYSTAHREARTSTFSLNVPSVVLHLHSESSRPTLRRRWHSLVPPSRALGPHLNSTKKWMALAMNWKNLGCPTWMDIANLTQTCYPLGFIANVRHGLSWCGPFSLISSL